MSRVLYLGRIVFTKGIADNLDDEQFRDDVAECLTKHMHGDFSGMEFEQDRRLNTEAFNSEDERVFTDFDTSIGKIWIITDRNGNPDENVTTVLFPEEY